MSFTCYELKISKNEIAGIRDAQKILILKCSKEHLWTLSVEDDVPLEFTHAVQVDLIILPRSSYLLYLENLRLKCEYVLDIKLVFSFSLHILFHIFLDERKHASRYSLLLLDFKKKLNC